MRRYGRHRKDGANRGKGYRAGLCTATSEIRTQGLCGEVRFPQAGCEQLDLQGGMSLDALQHIDQIDLGIDAVQATRRQHTVDDPDVTRAHFRPAEQPILAAQGDGPNLPLQLIGSQRHSGIGQEQLTGRESLPSA